MSDDFKNFSDAARLYAKHSGIVDQMQELFSADVTAFIDAVRDRVSSEIVEGKFDENSSSSRRYWWIVDDEMDDDYECPYLWIDTRLPKIVVPGVLDLSVAIDSVNDTHRRQIAELERTLPPQPNCKIVKGGLFTLRISYGEDDAVTLAAAPTLAPLKALYDVDRRLREKASKKANSAK